MRGRRISDKTKIKRGYGKGEGDKYKPMFTAWEVSSKGKKVRVMGLKTNREHLLLSTLEQDYFYYLDFSDDIIDIREQYPLDINITQALCEEFSIKHIRGKDGELKHYTTDFLITLKSGNVIARTCKYSKDLNKDERNIKKKFGIEREFYRRIGVEWRIVRECDFDRIRAKKIGSCYKMRTFNSI